MNCFKLAVVRVFPPWKLARTTYHRPQVLSISGPWIQDSFLLSFEFVSIKAHFFVLQRLLPSQHAWSPPSPYLTHRNVLTEELKHVKELA